MGADAVVLTAAVFAGIGAVHAGPAVETAAAAARMSAPATKTAAYFFVV
jgi:hypothetical protein